MLTRLSSWAAAAALCLTTLGCQCVECGDGCDRGCSMAFQKYDCGASGASCASGDECPCGAACGQESCDGACQGRHDGSWRERLCGCTGCGEMYWSEWHNDPPRIYEPCDCVGNFTGPGGAGYYQAPYRMGNRAAKSSATTPEPLEFADEEAVDEFDR